MIESLGEPLQNRLRFSSNHITLSFLRSCLSPPAPFISVRSVGEGRALRGSPYRVKMAMGDDVT